MDEILIGSESEYEPTVGFNKPSELGLNESMPFTVLITVGLFVNS